MRHLSLRLFSIAALGFCLIFAALNPGAARAQAAESACTKSGVFNGRVFLCGEVDEEMLEIAEANLFLKGETAVFIDSIGGSGQIASKISILLMRNRARVVIGRHCYSACAQFLVFADNVTVLPWTEIGIHHSNIAFAALKDEFEANGAVFDWSSIDAVADYTKFVAKLTNTDPTIFVEALDQLDVRCYDRAVLSNDTQLMGFEYQSRFKYWVPTREQINQARHVPIKGWWPKSWLAAVLPVNAAASPIDPLDIVYGSRPLWEGSAKSLRNFCG